MAEVPNNIRGGPLRCWFQFLGGEWCRNPATRKSQWGLWLCDGPHEPYHNDDSDRLAVTTDSDSRDTSGGA